jgi:hypothetical protein
VMVAWTDQRDELEDGSKVSVVIHGLWYPKRSWEVSVSWLVAWLSESSPTKVMRWMMVTGLGSCR